jgi:pilus assembly protein Flp/PilA
MSLPTLQRLGKGRETKAMLDTIRGLLRNEDGATMVEYAIMVALIAAICITVIGTLGQSVSNAFANMNASL